VYGCNDKYDNDNGGELGAESENGLIMGVVESVPSGNRASNADASTVGFNSKRLNDASPGFSDTILNSGPIRCADPIRSLVKFLQLSPIASFNIKHNKYQAQYQVILANQLQVYPKVGSE
jgi:hypothetical protein